MAVAPHVVLAQDESFPSRAVHIVVPFSAGGLPDVMARKLGDALSKNWKEPVVIENKAGAGSLIGGLAVARAPTDGHTILISPDPLLTVNHLMQKNPQLDPFTDFAPVAVLARFPMAIGVAASVPAKNLKELIALSKSKDINYGSLGPGTSPHLVTEMFKSLSGARMQQVSYRGTPAAMLALKSGDIQVLSISAGSLMPLARDGAVRILAVDGKTRFPQAPDVPTFEEEGFGRMGSGGFWAIVAPAGTPKPVVQKLNGDINKALKQPEFAKFLQTAGLQAAEGTPEELSKLMRETAELWAPTIKNLGIKLD
jgi:tripartite-type tricarboxylate transporter receptor subunit TctC